MSRALSSLLIGFVFLTLLCAQQNSEVYPNAKQCSAPQYQAFVRLPEGVTVTVYCVNTELENVLSYYSKLQGYKVVSQQSVTTIPTPEGSVKFGMLALKKGNEGIGITAISPKSGETIYWLVKGPVEKFATPVEMSMQQKLPSKDQARGEEPLQRYGNAVMLSYSRAEGFPALITIEYGTMDSPMDVFNWYRSYLYNAGWKLIEESSTAEKSWLEFEKGAEKVGIVVHSPRDVGYTSISIHYRAYRVPDRDLASGEEPLQRYPNSKMTSYSMTIYGGAKMITIEYASSDNYKRVVQWYKGFLTSAGWQAIVTEQEEGKSSLTATNQQAMVQIIITSRGTCSEIELFYQTIR